MQNPVLVVGSRKLGLDRDGHLRNPSDWDWSIAATFAREENIALNEKNTLLINIVRELFSTRPDLFLASALSLVKITEALGKEQREFFLKEVTLKQVCRIAGLPKPK